GNRRRLDPRRLDPRRPGGCRTLAFGPHEVTRRYGCFPRRFATIPLGKFRAEDNSGRAGA
ncbi:MAG: hypothetical protein WAU06_00135, partial [Candidatus Nanopelagicales bacterium]